MQQQKARRRIRRLRPLDCLDLRAAAITLSSFVGLGRSRHLIEPAGLGPQYDDGKAFPRGVEPLMLQVNPKEGPEALASTAQRKVEGIETNCLGWVMRWHANLRNWTAGSGANRRTANSCLKNLQFTNWGRWPRCSDSGL
jgi:hypothetical protein